MVEGFNAKHPNVTVKVEDPATPVSLTAPLLAAPPGRGPARRALDRETTRPRSSGTNSRAASATWKKLGYTDEIAKGFPTSSAPSSRLATSICDARDSGPVVMFYRRDFYEKAGVDPCDHQDRDDFIAAGKKVMAANPASS